MSFSQSLRSNNIPRAIMFMMLSVAAYATQDVFIKLLPSEISVIQICFFRGVFSFIPIIIFSRFEKKKQFLRTDSIWLHFWRSLVSTLALFCFIGAFRLIPLAEAYAITFSCPLFMTLLCIPILREKVSRQRWLAVITGFIGVLVVMQPGQEALQLGGLLALLGGLFYAISLVLIRHLSDRDNNTMIIVTFNLMSTSICAALLPFNWEPFELEFLSHFVAIGVLGGCAQYAMTQAFRTGAVSAIAPFDYIALLWALGYGYFIWNEAPDVNTILGSVLIILAGLYIIRHERRSV